MANRYDRLSRYGGLERTLALIKSVHRLLDEYLKEPPRKAVRASGEEEEDKGHRSLVLRARTALREILDKPDMHLVDSLISSFFVGLHIYCREGPYDTVTVEAKLEFVQRFTSCMKCFREFFRFNTISPKTTSRWIKQEPEDYHEMEAKNAPRIAELVRQQVKELETWLPTERKDTALRLISNRGFVHISAILQYWEHTLEARFFLDQELDQVNVMVKHLVQLETESLWILGL
jgi:hypothetical protein